MTLHCCQLLFAALQHICVVVLWLQSLYLYDEEAARTVSGLACLLPSGPVRIGNGLMPISTYPVNTGGLRPDCGGNYISWLSPRRHQ